MAMKQKWLVVFVATNGGVGRAFYTADLGPMTEDLILCFEDELYNAGNGGVIVTNIVALEQVEE